MKKKTIIFEVIIIFLFSVFMIIWNVGCKNIVCNIYGGVEYNYGDINVLAMGKWLFVFAMYFLITGYEMLNNQRMFLDELQTMSLSRYIILVNSKKEISPENLDYKYMKYKVKTPASNEEEGEVLLSFDDVLRVIG